MSKKIRTKRAREREAPEAPRGLRSAMKRCMKEIQATVWKMRFLMLFWATWMMTLFLVHDPLRLILLMAPLSLCCIYNYADLAREWALQILILIGPQCILNLMLREEMSVAQYALKYELMEKHKKQRGGTVIFCSKYGISLWRGFIEVIISANTRNKSWGGSFSLEDLRMSGHRCRIKSEPAYAGTNANLLLDLSRLAHLLLAEFSPNGVPIKYVKLLFDDLTKASTLSPVPTKSQMLDFFKNHPALKSPRQLTTFTSELFKAYKMLGLTKKQELDTIVSAVPGKTWVKQTRRTQDRLLMKVLTYDRYDPNNTQDSYDSTPNELFRYLRNFQEHGADRDVTTGVQNLHKIKDMEFIATYEYTVFIRGLIYHLIVKADMKELTLDYAWSNYIEYVPIM